MKVSGAIIQKRSISVCTSTDFEATYKGKRITITTDHGFGTPQYAHLKRYSMDVVDIKTKMYDVQSYGDFHTMQDAIRSALRGAYLIK